MLRKFGIIIVVTIRMTAIADVFMAGDSTSCPRSENAHFGSWIQMCEPFLKPEVKLQNFALSGYSTASFMKRWDEMMKFVQKGDFVIIQFGHNDGKADPKRHTDPDGSYKDNLRKFIKDVRAKNAIPILVTSIVRRTFDENGKLVDKDGLSSYAHAMREVATELKVELVDMNKSSEQEIRRLGDAESAKLYMISHDKKDNTHPTRTGAEVFAKLFLNEVATQRLSIAQIFNL